MKNHNRHPLFLFGALLLAAATLFNTKSDAAPLVDYNFNSLTAGPLNTQDGWSTLNTRISPTVAIGPGGSPSNTSLMLTNATTAGDAMTRKVFFTAGSVNNLSTITLTADFYAGGNGSVEVFGVGAPSYNTVPSAQFGIFGGNFWLRGEANGAIATPLTSGNAAIAATLGQWYQIQSVWNLSANNGAGSATFAIKNLTAGETAFTSLYFDAAQTQTTASLGIATNPNTWTSGYVRMGGSAIGVGYIDNLNVVPEPSTAILLGLGLAGLLVPKRRRSVSAV